MAQDNISTPSTSDCVDGEERISMTRSQLQEMLSAEFIRWQRSQASTVIPESPSCVSGTGVEDHQNVRSEVTGGGVNVNVNRIAFKPPQPLYNQNPTVWFSILEMQFGLAGITGEATKLAHAIGALDARLHNQLADLIIKDKGPCPYAFFKNEVIRILGESESQRLNNVLHNLTLENKKPSQLLAEFKLNAGTTFSDGTLKQLWLQRLPHHIQLILTTFENDVSLNILAERADRMLEVMSSSRDVQGQLNSLETKSVFGESSRSASVPVAAGSNSSLEKYNLIADSLREILFEIRSGSSNKENSRARSKSRGNYRRSSRSRNRSASRINPKFDQCFYHYKFADKALHCRPGCKFFDQFSHSKQKF